MPGMDYIEELCKLANSRKYDQIKNSAKSKLLQRAVLCYVR